MDIVIIDDEPKIRNGLHHMLARQLAWNVAGVFDNALSALEYLEKHHIDVIITDIKMPEMNGLEMIARLREKNMGAYVIILSGYSDFRFAQQAIELGVFRYMVKPTNPRELLEILEQVERKRQKTEISQSEEKVKVGNLLVEKAVEYIEENYVGKISLKDIASHLYVTPNYLSNLFKQHTGKTMSSYITDYRLKKAEEYLKRPEYSIMDIAELVGIENARYFSNIFKKKYGQTPSEYRNRRNI